MLRSMLQLKLNGEYSPLQVMKPQTGGTTLTQLGLHEPGELYPEGKSLILLYV